MKNKLGKICKQWRMYEKKVYTVNGVNGIENS